VNPSVLVRQIQKAVEDYLRLSFRTTTPLFEGVLESFLARPGSFYKGPYLSIKLPFQVGEGGPEIYPDVPLPYALFKHQETAFRRIGADGHSTLVATGTGSGKTECFLVPILDYCRRHQGQRGIKAILIYPMNALASDQAKRIAELINNAPALKGRITAGLFIGAKEANPSTFMGDKRIITDRETLHSHPPDILLTNYKMLDFLLIRTKDAVLWRHNDPETLKYLVVDELHTFDGAQGTDLACLIRRLKARLETPPGHLVCVGTSATIGGERSKQTLSQYAANVFDEPFDGDSVVTEFRQTLGDYLAQSPVEHIGYPGSSENGSLDAEQYANEDEYALAQARLWFPDLRYTDHPWYWRVDLAGQVRCHYLFQNLLRLIKGGISSWPDLLFSFKQTLRLGDGADEDYIERLLSSLMSLVAVARDDKVSVQELMKSEETVQPARKLPFLNVRVQLWMRELRRMQVQLPVGNDKPRLVYADDADVPEDRIALPAIHCRDCGAMGWVSARATDQLQVATGLDVIYSAWFSNSPKVCMLFPLQGVDLPPLFPDKLQRKLCAGCGQLNDMGSVRCGGCGGSSLIWVHEPASTQVSTNRATGVRLRKTHKICPFCDGRNSLLILGSRATSISAVAAGQLNTSRFNSDKYLIAFSDSVQDAAHRAGFIASRTRSFGFRTALKQVVDSLAGPTPLPTLQRAFNEHWHEQLGVESFIGIFIPQNMEWLRDYAVLVRERTLPAESNLGLLVRKRMAWEITAEFGLRCRIGRSMDRSGAATTLIDHDRLEQAVGRIRQLLAEEVGAFRELEAEPLRRFLLGLMAHLRIVGGIWNPDLEAFIVSGGNTYEVSRQVHMPGLGPGTLTPRFLATKKTRGFESFETNQTDGTSWYRVWLYKALLSGEEFQLIDGLLEPVYIIVLRELTTAGLLGEWQTTKGVKVLGLLPEALLVDAKAVSIQCAHCLHGHTIHISESELWEGMACLRKACGGRYTVANHHEEGPNFYGRVYRDGNVDRIVAGEHTGLLNRDERAEVEASFQRKPPARRPWDINLLSATPTLELGVDIGELSSVMLCSVPPAQANYLQRIGRSGRRDGNAVNITLANGNPHDLYFYEAPMEMMAGDVDTPGVFLDASAVLERQYTAFCLDYWVKARGEKAIIPGRLGTVLSAVASDRHDINKFPYTVLSYVENHRTALIDGFLRLFSSGSGSGLSDFSIDWIKRFAEGDQAKEGSLSFRVEERFRYQLREFESLSKEAKRLNTLARRLRGKSPRSPEDDEKLLEFEREVKALQDLAARIKAKDTLQFMTDEGLIPNYTFPEQGVLLRSVIYRSRKDNQDAAQQAGTVAESERWVYEYERPAVAALSELAPSNTFYAGGRRVQISRVDMRVSAREWWRLCERCHHSERIDTGDHCRTCPRCGAVSWEDQAQKKSMLRLRQVYAETADRRSRITDDKDDRDRAFYTRQLLVDFEPSAITAAWRFDKESWPFGFEFISRADFREFNSGGQDENADEVIIAGQRARRKGFRLCQYCGMVQKETDNEEKAQVHTLGCTAQNTENPNNIIDGIYLYREFRSEAIRILLPVTKGTEAEVIENSFVAALHLGLKKKFGGSIDHLHVAQSIEPDTDTGENKRYLVIYDAVPGGTGYLKQLMGDQSALIDVLIGHALPVLERCSCTQIEGADGCYRCLYAYSNSRDMSTISRLKARDFLQIIKENADKVVPVASLREVSLSPLVESELEARFIEGLRRSGSEVPEFEIRPEFQGTDAGWYLRYGQRRYFVHPQYQLGQADGVAVPSRADFLIRPLGDPQALPIAIYTDGFQYHRDRVDVDTAQRMAIIASGRFLSWSLTYRDVQGKLDSNRSDQVDLLAGMERDKAEQLLGQYECSALLHERSRSSFDWLVRYLKDPDFTLWRKYASTLSLVWFMKGQESLEATQAFDALVSTNIISDRLGDLAGSTNRFLIDAGALLGESAKGMELGIAVDKQGVRSGDVTKLGAIAVFNDDSSLQDASIIGWGTFLRIANLIQFQPHSSFLSRQGMKRERYLEIVTVAGGTETAGDDWDGLVQDALAEEQGLIVTLRREGVSPPELGFELEAGGGEISAEALLAWPEFQVAVLRDGMTDDVTVFTDIGWTVFDQSSVEADVSPLVQSVR